jgi:hypothetical protein
MGPWIATWESSCVGMSSSVSTRLTSFGTRRRSWQIRPAMRLCGGGWNHVARWCLELRQEEKAVERGVARGGDQFGILFIGLGARRRVIDGRWSSSRWVLHNSSWVGRGIEGGRTGCWRGKGEEVERLPFLCGGGGQRVLSSTMTCTSAGGQRLLCSISRKKTQQLGRWWALRPNSYWAKKGRRAPAKKIETRPEWAVGPC